MNPDLEIALQLLLTVGGVYALLVIKNNLYRAVMGTITACNTVFLFANLLRVEGYIN